MSTFSNGDRVIYDRYNGFSGTVKTGTVVRTGFTRKPLANWNESVDVQLDDSSKIVVWETEFVELQAIT